MTAAYLQRRVNYWQIILAHLGLQHWKGEVEIVDEARGDEDAAAAVTVSGTYDSFWIEFCKEHVEEATPTRVDEYIVHELLHVAMRDFDAALLSVWGQVSPGFASAWSSRVDHEKEGLIERLARLIVALHSATDAKVVQFQVNE